MTLMLIVPTPTVLTNAFVIEDSTEMEGFVKVKLLDIR